ncbi:ERVV2 protein, partial [Anseranas semipalmata]|nr:ERVV2 protein [Anseranas semipalmata]
LPSNPFHFWFIPWSGASKLEEAVVDICATTEMVTSNTMGAITAVHEEVSQLLSVVFQNWMATGVLPASQGGVCATLNTSCCVCADQTGQISTDTN